ncbi:hypothetical protein BGZ63DRAFT_249617 [Mariannaea sp. PMI_226]|nr:hypothetical protein BGZ63DRAFT_249617 [Mariannaea sp. PMI_226]
MRGRLQAETSKHLQYLQTIARRNQHQADYEYPGANKDRLYAPDHTHKHRTSCDLCANNPDIFCDVASKTSCIETECGSTNLIARERPVHLIQGADFSPQIFIGRIGSGNTVMKNGRDRDRIATRHGLIAFEMEGAGVWDEVPCIIVKGICDYADSHKNKAWQDFAAATAAAVAKAILGRYTIHDGDRGFTQTNDQRRSNAYSIRDKVYEPCYYIPLTRNIRFTGRASILNALEEKFFGQDQTQKVALVGLGGVGKSQIALRFAHQIKEKRPGYSIFWVPVVSDESAERAYAEIAKTLGLQKSSEDDDVKDLVCQHLSSDKAGRWLFVVDNADEHELILGSAEKPGLEEYLPQSENGIILLTTRSRQVAAEFAQWDVIDIEQMDMEEATDLLRSSLVQKRLLQDKVSTVELLTRLTFLPLAITQAAAYLNQTKAPMRTYLDLLRGAEDNVARVLGREFRDNTRYRGSRNAVGTTWMVSFDQIQKSDQIAVDLLSFMSFIEPKAIPQSILPDAASDDELEWAIGTLCSYSFLVRRGETNIFDMHSLVHTAMRGWLKKQDRERQVSNDVICHLAARFPARNDAHYDLRREYLPHAIRLLNRNHENKTVEIYHLFEKVGNSFKADRRFKEAIRCLEEVCWWRQGLHSEADHIRLTSEHELASTYLNNRQIKDAIKIFEHVVAIRKETLDEKDHSRLTSEHELASAYLNNRQIKDAIKIFEYVVAIRKETLDEKDHSRLALEHALASAYLDSQQIMDAIKIFEHVVAVRKETLDKKDHSRLISEHELGRAYLDNLQIKDAINILEHVVSVKADILADDDPSGQRSNDLLQLCYRSL